MLHQQQHPRGHSGIVQPIKQSPCPPQPVSAQNQLARSACLDHQLYRWLGTLIVTR